MANLVRIQSTDGTEIAVERAGRGPHLVLVHGTSASRDRWGNVRALLEPHFTLSLVDRRGRGDSGDAGTYSLEREFDDVAAVVDACDGPALLFGHSYGGLVALGAAGRTANIAAIILYEAPIFEVAGIDMGIITRMEKLLESGDRAGVIELFCRELVRMRPADIDALRGSPAWPARLAAAHTIPREMRAANGLRLASTHPGRITWPTLLLHGGESPDFFKAAMAHLAGVIPDTRSVALAGQQHVAMDTAPRLLADEVIGFWMEVRG